MDKPLTWRCRVCGDERPDEKISVHSTMYYLNGVEFKHNVCYCNDRPECIEAAKTIDLTKGDV